MDQIRACMLLEGDVIFKENNVTIVKRWTENNWVMIELSDGKKMTFDADDKIYIFTYDKD